MHPPVLILHAPGTNRDRDAALACTLAGGSPEIVHINQLSSGEKSLADYRMLVVPGGFSFGDDLGAGKVWATLLKSRFADDLHFFVDSGRPVLGICNGFQVLVKTGLLPGAGLDNEVALGDQAVTLTHNLSSTFECRWVYLEPNPRSPCVFTSGATELIHCPVAHGEGRLVARDASTLATIERHGLAALRYVSPDGSPPRYPHNPNGSDGNIAGLTNRAGNVLGLMPHPEDHLFSHQHPRHHRGESGQLGRVLFTQGIRHAAEM